MSKLEEDLLPFGEVDGTTIFATADLASGNIEGIGATFRQDAAVYDERFYDPSGQISLLRRGLAAFGREGGDRKIDALDIGCGSGNATSAIYEVFPNARVWSTDLSPEMLAIVVRRLRAERLDRHTAFVADATRIGIQPESFDLIIGSSMVHHLVEPAPFLDKCLQALRPGGTAMFLEPFRSGHFAVRIILASLIRMAADKGGIDQKHLDFWKGYIFTVDTMCSDAERRGSFYEKLEDKWMFSRDLFESAAERSGCRLNIDPPTTKVVFKPRSSS